MATLQAENRDLRAQLRLSAVNDETFDLAGLAEVDDMLTKDLTPTELETELAEESRWVRRRRTQRKRSMKYWSKYFGYKDKDQYINSYGRSCQGHCMQRLLLDQHDDA